MNKYTRKTAKRNPLHHDFVTKRSKKALAKDPRSARIFGSGSQMISIAATSRKRTRSPCSIMSMPPYSSIFFSLPSRVR